MIMKMRLVTMSWLFFNLIRSGYKAKSGLEQANADLQLLSFIQGEK